MSKKKQVIQAQSKQKKSQHRTESRVMTESVDSFTEWVGLRNKRLNVIRSDSIEPQATLFTDERLPIILQRALIAQIEENQGNQQLQRLTTTLMRKPNESVIQRAIRTPEQVETLINQILRAIARHETGERAVESRMRTSAGVSASLASQVQATIPWAITALLNLDDQTLQSQFQLTRAELRSARNRERAAKRLWNAVHSSPSSETAQTFGNTHQTLLAQSGLTQNDLERMFQFRNLRRETIQQHQRRQTQLQALSNQQLWDRSTSRDRRRRRGNVTNVNQLSNSSRRTRLIKFISIREISTEMGQTSLASNLQIPSSSLDAYLRGSWAEDRMAWIRIAIQREPPAQPNTQTTGNRIEAATTSEGGLRLGRERISSFVNSHLQNHPSASDEDVCRAVARTHNPGRGRPYVNSVLHHFQQIQQSSNSTAQP